MKNYRDGLTAEDRFALRCMFHAKHSNASESRQALQKAMTEGFARKHKSGFHVVWKKSATPRSEHSVQNQRDLDAVLERLMGTQEASPKLRAVKKTLIKLWRVYSLKRIQDYQKSYMQRYVRHQTITLTKHKQENLSLSFKEKTA